MTRPNALDRCRGKLLSYSLVEAGDGKEAGHLAEFFCSYSLPALPESDGKARSAAFTGPEAEQRAKEGDPGQETPGKTAFPVSGGDVLPTTLSYSTLPPPRVLETFGRMEQLSFGWYQYVVCFMWKSGVRK